MVIKQQNGFSLIESIILIMIIGVIATPIASTLMTGASSLNKNKNIQLGVAEARACAEHVLFISRDPAQGYATVIAQDTTICDAVSSPLSPLSRSVTLSDATAEAACPTGASACRLVLIDITESGTTVASVNLLLVN